MADVKIPYTFSKGQYRAKVITRYKDENNVNQSVASEPFTFDISGPKDTWVAKTWYKENGELMEFEKGNLWTDGDNIYYKDDYVLNKTTDIWEWANIHDTPNGFYAFDVWTDGENTYSSGR